MSPRACAVIVAWAVGASFGCGPGIELDDPDGGMTTAAESDATRGDTTTAPATDATDDTAAASSTSDATGMPPSGGYEEDDGGTGCTFTCPPPPPPPPPPGGGGGFNECDLPSQDCPEGEKCMPWANDGGQEWNATRCAPVADDPHPPGEACAVEGSGFSGIDDCELGAMCWQVDPETNTGTCVALCPGAEQVCVGDLGCSEINETVSLCLDGCDPLALDCPVMQGCFPVGASFACQATAEEPLPIGSPCSTSRSCGVGSLCARGMAYDCGADPGDGCCAITCDLGDPSTCMGASICVPWFAVDPPASLANLGTCTAP